MSAKDVVRAWKDEHYLSTLSPAEISALPQNPAGTIELHSYRKTQISVTPPNCSAVIECSASNCA